MAAVLGTALGAWLIPVVAGAIHTNVRPQAYVSTETKPHLIDRFDGKVAPASGEPAGLLHELHLGEDGVVVFDPRSSRELIALFYACQ